ncbi:hypothetical protein IX51_04205 [uncultured archaeon]|nr:hypothetical protein IX51_04205 [uncultured archaeon]HKJ96819.1 hypothetical protein [Thermoplasmataceae archaeon]
MDETSKLALAISIPLWASLAAMVAFAAYYTGLAGVGIMFVIVIVATFYWFKALENFTTRTQAGKEQEIVSRSEENRLNDIEAKLEEISRKMKP